MSRLIVVKFMLNYSRTLEITDRIEARIIKLLVCNIKKQMENQYSTEYYEQEYMNMICYVCNLAAYDVDEDDLLYLRKEIERCNYMLEIASKRLKLQETFSKFFNKDSSYWICKNKCYIRYCEYYPGPCSNCNQDNHLRFCNICSNFYPRYKYGEDYHIKSEIHLKNTNSVSANLTSNIFKISKNKIDNLFIILYLHNKMPNNQRVARMVFIEDGPIQHLKKIFEKISRDVYGVLIKNSFFDSFEACSIKEKKICKSDKNISDYFGNMDIVCFIKPKND